MTWNVVALAGVRHVRHQVVAGLEEAGTRSGGLRGVAARGDCRSCRLSGITTFSVMWPTHSSIMNMTGHAELLGEVEGRDGQVEALLRRVGAEGDDARSRRASPSGPASCRACAGRVGRPVEGPPRCTLTNTQGVSVMAA